MEKKEQEAIARNAQSHQQKLGTLQGLMTTDNSPEENAVNTSNTEGNHANFPPLHTSLFLYDFLLIIVTN